MKRLRRVAALLAALALGATAWFAIVACLPASGELRLARELSTGWITARVPRPRPLLFGLIDFGPPTLSARYEQPDAQRSGPLPDGLIFEGQGKSAGGPYALWYVRLDPLDKSWEVEVAEKRMVYLRVGKWKWRVGTKTRLWRTRRRNEQ